MFPKVPSKEFQLMTNELLSTPGYRDTRLEFDSSDLYGLGIYVIRDPFFIYFLGSRPGISYYPLTLRTITDYSLWDRPMVIGSLSDVVSIAKEISESKEDFPLQKIRDLRSPTREVLARWKFGIEVHPRIGFHGKEPLLKTGHMFYNGDFIQKIDREDRSYIVSDSTGWIQRLPYSECHRSSIPDGSLVITQDYLTTGMPIYRVCNGNHSQPHGIEYMVTSELSNDGRVRGLNQLDLAGVLRWGP